MLDFAEQQLVDCSFGYFNDGCRGGELSYAYKYLMDYNFEVENNYKYAAKDQACNYYRIAYRPGNKVWKYVEHNNTNNEDLKWMLHENTVSVAVEARGWKFYKSGIFDADECDEEIDHGVLLTGYNVGDNYWKIKNSWSARWGEQGYIRLPITTEKKFKDGTCGILNRPSYPIIH